MTESATPEHILDYAQLLIRKGEALEALDCALTLAGQPMPSSERGRCLATQAVALEGLYREDEAATLIENAMAEEEEDFGFILSAGMTFSDLDTPGHAETFLENLCELDPENPASWHNYAIVLGRMERYEEAVKAYQHALERDAGFAPALAQMAYCLQILGDVDSAVVNYQKYLKLEPGDGEAWTSLAMLLSAGGDSAGAYAAYRRALDAGCDPEHVYLNWGLTAAQDENVTALEEVLTELEHIATGGWRTWMLRGEVRELHGDLESAAQAFDTAVEIAMTDSAPEAAEFAAASAMRFALRNESDELADSVEGRILENRWFTDELLELIRYRRGHTAEAASYQVVFGEAESLQWVYGVIAESPEDAEEYAQHFHRQAGYADSPTLSIHQLSEPTESLVGVYWQSEEEGEREE